MTLPKPYPPTPIDYEDWNTIIDVLEVRFGSGAAGFIRDRTRIVNSRGNIREKAAGNVQLAIEESRKGILGEVSYRRVLEIVRGEGVQGKAAVAIADRTAFWLYKVMKVKVWR